MQDINLTEISETRFPNSKNPYNFQKKILIINLINNHILKWYKISNWEMKRYEIAKLIENLIQKILIQIYI